MKINFLFAIALLTYITNSFASRNDDYPKTLEERRSEEIGSIVGGKGLTFSPGKIKNESTKTEASRVNKYLWQAAIEALSFAPLASVDNNGGLIITDWYSPKSKPQFNFKIQVFIKDNVISPNSIEVKVFQKTLKNGTWISRDDTESGLVITLEDKILRRARELYIQSEKQ